MVSKVFERLCKFVCFLLSYTVDVFNVAFYRDTSCNNECGIAVRIRYSAVEIEKRRKMLRDSSVHQVYLLLPVSQHGLG